jgi:hypothetical protein
MTYPVYPTHGSSALVPVVTPVAPIEQPKQESLAIFDAEWVKEQEARKYCLDNASKNFGNASEMLEFLEEREENANWIVDVETQALELRLLEDSVIYDTFSELTTDTAKNTGLVLQCLGLEVPLPQTPLRTCALPTLQDRAQIAGKALTKVGASVYRDILNNCLDVASKKSKCKVRIADGKISVVLSSSYVPLSMPEIFDTAINYIQTRFPRNTFAGGYWNHSMSMGEWELTGEYNLVKDYINALSKHGIEVNADEVQPGLRLTSSDIGISGVNLVPKLVVGKDRLLLPLGSVVRLEHKGEANMNRFRENLEGVFALYGDGLEKLAKLLDVEIANPAGCMEAVLKHLGIAQKYAKPTLEAFERAYSDGETCTAHDIYYGLGELLMQLQIHNVTGEVALRIEESIAKALTLNYANYDKPKKESN